MVENLGKEKKTYAKEVPRKIVALLGQRGTLRFGELKQALNVCDSTVARGLKKLQETKPPVVIKNLENLYSINWEHPLIDDILSSNGISRANTPTYPVLSVSDLNDPSLGFKVFVVSSFEKGLDADLCVFFEEYAAKLLMALYRDVLKVKYHRVLKNENLSNDSDDESIQEACRKIEQRLLKEGVEIHILPEKGGKWKHLQRERNKKEKERAEKIKAEMDKIA